MTSSPSAPPGESIAVRLRRLRREAGLSQRQLAGPGVTAAYISRIEAGARTPSVKALRTLARKLGVSADYLETGLDVRDDQLRELRLADAELELRLGGDAAAVAPSFRALLDDAVAAADLEAEARARVGLGLAAAAAGDHAEAIEQLEQVAGAAVISAAVRPDAYVALARSLAAVGRPGRAVEVLQRALEDLRDATPGDSVTRLRLETALGRLLDDLGDHDRARGAVRRTDAADPLDPLDHVRLHWEQGRAAAARRDPRAGLSHFRRGLAVLDAADETAELARAHLTRAQLLADDDRDAALAELERAEQLLGPGASATDRARLRTERALHALHDESFDQALDDAQTALGLLGDAEPAHRARLLRIRGDALFGRGDTVAAFEAYERSLALFEDAGELHEAAATARAWGTRLRRAGRETDALDAMERAADLATRAGVTRLS